MNKAGSVHHAPVAADGLQEYLDDVRVELRGGAALDLGHRVLERQGLSVRPVGGERVEGVCHGEYPRLEREVRALFLVRVSLAVVALVVLADDYLDVL